MTTPGPFSGSGAAEQVAELLERMQQTTESLDAMAVQQQAEWDQARAQWVEEDEQRARLARSGELGPQWQRLQGRIDLEETSVGEILRGGDDSVDAELVRADAQRRAEEMGAQLQEQDEEGREPELQAQRAEMAELSQLLDELRAFVAGPDRRPPA